MKKRLGWSLGMRWRIFDYPKDELNLKIQTSLIWDYGFLSCELSAGRNFFLHRLQLNPGESWETFF